VSESFINLHYVYYCNLGFVVVCVIFLLSIFVVSSGTSASDCMGDRLTHSLTPGGRI